MFFNDNLEYIYIFVQEGKSVHFILYSLVLFIVY